jgi:hypothetical protein
VCKLILNSHHSTVAACGEIKQMNREEKLTGDWSKEIHLKIHKEIKYFLNDLIVTSLIV